MKVSVHALLGFSLVALCATAVRGAVELVFVTPAYLKEASVPFDLEVRETELGSYELKLSVAPSVPYRAPVECSLIVADKSLSEAGLSTEERNRRIMADMIRRDTKVGIAAASNSPLSKVLYVNGQDAPFTALRIYYPRFGQLDVMYYILVGTFTQKSANKTVQPTPGSVTPRASSSTSK